MSFLCLVDGFRIPFGDLDWEIEFKEQSFRKAKDSSLKFFD